MSSDPARQRIGWIVFMAVIIGLIAIWVNLSKEQKCTLLHSKSRPGCSSPSPTPRPSSP